MALSSQPQQPVMFTTKCMIERDPMSEAHTYLLLNGVAYNDLITGDHAAALLVKWATIVTEQNARILALLDE